MTGISADMIMNMLHPGLIMVCLGVLVVLLPKIMRYPLVILAPVISMWAVLQMNEDSSLRYDIASYIRMEFIRFDNISSVLVTAFCIMAVLIGLYGAGIQDKYEAGASLIYAGCTMGTVLAGDCISLLIFWETGIAASVCLIYSGHRRESAGASIRYFIAQAASAGLMLAGLITYMFHYGNSLDNISSYYGEPCFWLIAASAALYAAVPPLHAWLPDAFPESSKAGILSLCVFGPGTAVYLMIRLLGGLELMIWAGIIAAMYAAVMSLMENNIRRLLSYQLISQTGIIAAAIGAGSEAGTDAAIAHLLTVMLCMSVMMMCAGNVMHSAGRSKITELGGMAKKMPVTAVCFLICSLGITGMPGLIGFVSRTMVTDLFGEPAKTVQSALIIMAFAGTLLAVTLRAGWFMFFGPKGEHEAAVITQRPTFSMTAAMVIGTAAAAAGGVFSDRITDQLPYMTACEAFGVEDIAVYLALFIGCAIPFFVFVRKIRPRDEITLDMDWFLRKIVK